jgi:hypothetical protein
MCVTVSWGAHESFMYPIFVLKNGCDTFIPYQDNIPYITEISKTINSNLEIKGSENYRDEALGENVEVFHITNSSIECISLQSLAPNWYRDVKSKKDIDKIVQRLKDIHIIREIPMKHWDKNGIVYRINITNLDYIIKSSPIEATPKDRRI